MAAQLPIVLTNGISHTYSKREKITYQEMFDTASTGTKNIKATIFLGVSNELMARGVGAVYIAYQAKYLFKAPTTSSRCEQPEITYRSCRS